MTIWLYTETTSPLRDGPYFSVEHAMTSPLWEWFGACVWLEWHGVFGWCHENVRWNGTLWVVTSSAARAVPPTKPSYLLEAVQWHDDFEGGHDVTFKRYAVRGADANSY